MAESKSTVSRRSFLAAVGAVGAAAAVPVSVGAGLGASPPRLPPRTALLEGWRALYAVELETLAETLRPRFEAGELHAFRDEDESLSWREGPVGKLEAAAAAHFDLDDLRMAHMILAVSPHEESTGVDMGAGDESSHAAEAVAWDVIALARERGWYTPTADESGDPAAEVRS